MISSLHVRRFCRHKCMPHLEALRLPASAPEMHSGHKQPQGQLDWYAQPFQLGKTVPTDMALYKHRKFRPVLP